jgi:hypothetical protein
LSPVAALSLSKSFCNLYIIVGVIYNLELILVIKIGIKEPVVTSGPGLQVKSVVLGKLKATKLM